MEQQGHIKVYNTLTKNKDVIAESTIGMYVCGPTVYDVAHIGHARSAYNFDVIIKYMRWRGKKLTFVRNVTDVDDKIIQRAQDEIASGGPEYAGLNLVDACKNVSVKYLASYHEDLAAMGLARPDFEPKATETIPDMIEFIKILIEKGFAYSAPGGVYFNVRKFEKYGALSGQSLDDMEEGARVAVDKSKKDPLDFALWKAAKEGEPSWSSPWGDGRPGWHIECSVMSRKYLRDDFLIHGGGLDLVFPHHENEIAQTVCAGEKSAKYWIHNGLLTINGQKMSKSLGNYITVKDFKVKYKDLDLLKLLFLSSHYRHPVDFTDEKIRDMAKMKERINIFITRVHDERSKNPGSPAKKENSISHIEEKFVSAMDDDFNTPEALADIFEAISEGNSFLDKGDIQKAVLVKDAVEKIAGIFGLSLSGGHAKLDAELEKMIKERNDAKRSKDFKRADAIRKELLGKGIILEDTKEGTTWRVRS